ncbi:hypothetical protein F4811DRAFT_332410 [Daldinia bambusicola]|nr:hypothetical protein F4811DRAFT_332410 [Daldinia bambusicola]
MKDDVGSSRLSPLSTFLLSTYIVHYYVHRYLVPAVGWNRDAYLGVPSSSTHSCTPVLFEFGIHNNFVLTGTQRNETQRNGNSCSSVFLPVVLVFRLGILLILLLFSLTIILNQLIHTYYSNSSRNTNYVSNHPRPRFFPFLLLVKLVLHYCSSL